MTNNELEKILAQSVDLTPQYVADFLKYEMKLHRFDHLHLRYYFEVAAGELESYISFTSLAKALIPKGHGYDEWLMNLGHDAIQARARAAEFGTLVHKEFADAILGIYREGHGRGYNFDYLDEHTGRWVDGPFGKEKETIFHTMIPMEYKHFANSWRRKFKMNMASLFQWYADKVTKTIAVEVMVRSKRMRVGGTIDLVHGAHYYGVERGCITDLKSWLWDEADDRKRKSKFDAHDFQLEGQKRTWNELFPQYPVTHTFNVSPKKWRGETPTYTWSYKSKTKYSEMCEHNGVTMSGYEYAVGFAKSQGLMDPPSKAATIIGGFKDINDWNPVNHVTKF